MFGFAALAALSSMDSTQSVELDFPRANEIVVRLSGKTILTGRLDGLHGRKIQDAVKVIRADTPAAPMFFGYPHGPKTADWVPVGQTKTTWRLEFMGPGVSFKGSILAGSDRRPCTASVDGPLASTFGSASSSLDDAIYDRTDDWLLDLHSPIGRTSRGFAFSATSPEIVLKTDYFRNHLGYFLWDNKRPLWSQPVAGWCSWAAYGQDVTEHQVAEAAKFFSSHLRDYGYNVVQIDDGYQRVVQLTDNHQPITEPFANYWTKPNEKFPSGMGAMAKKISDLGMTPGIWVGLYLPIGLKHSTAYVSSPDGKPLQGPWVGYSMDSGDPAAVAEAYTDALKTFREQGWRYFKIDTLRHVLYDSYRRVPEYWTQRHTDSSNAYRKLFTAVRDAVGKDNYLLACWGALPELAGLPDGCRIGEDVGPAFASMRRSAKYISQFHYANHVIWRNDPDYMCLRVPVEQCQTWATLTSLTGEHVMVSDPVESYDAPRVDILRRVGPPVVTKPASVTPAKPDPEWVTLNASKGKETWTVAARMAWKPLSADLKPLAQLGLQKDREYLAFDFWESKFLGVVKWASPFAVLDQGQCQVVSFRPVTGVPQVLGDDRHVSQGAYELSDVAWKDQTLSGKFRRTRGRAWNLYLYVPSNWEVNPESNATLVEPHVLKVSFPEGDGWTDWSVNFREVH